MSHRRIKGPRSDRMYLLRRNERTFVTEVMTRDGWARVSGTDDDTCKAAGGIQVTYEEGQRLLQDRDEHVTFYPAETEEGRQLCREFDELGKRLT